MPITIIETHDVQRDAEPRRLALVRRGSRWAVVDLLTDDGAVLTAGGLEHLTSDSDGTTSITWRTEARARAELRHFLAQEGPCTTTVIFDRCAACNTSGQRSASSPPRRGRGRR